MPLNRSDKTFFERVATKIDIVLNVDHSGDGLYGRFTRIRVEISVSSLLKHGVVVLDNLGIRCG